MAIAERIQDRTEHRQRPLGETVTVSRRGLLIARARIAGLLVAVAVAAGVVAAEELDAEKREKESSEDEEEETEDDGVLDGRGVEGDGRGAVAVDGDVAETILSVFELLVFDGADHGRDGQDEHDQPLVHLERGVHWAPTRLQLRGLLQNYP